MDEPSGESHQEERVVIMLNDPLLPVLAQVLRDRDWREEDNTLYAPHETIWLDLSVPWPDSVEKYQQQIRGRLERISRGHDDPRFQDDLRKSISDTSELLAAIDFVIGSAGKG